MAEWKKFSLTGDGDAIYLKLDGSNANTTLDIGSEDFTTTGDITATNIAGTITTATQAQIDHDSLLNFAANEHIDWTNASDNLVTTGNITTPNITRNGDITIDATGAGNLHLTAVGDSIIFSSLLMESATGNFNWGGDSFTGVGGITITSSYTIYCYDIIPRSNGTENLGRTDYRWNNIYSSGKIYSANLDVDTLNLNGNVISDSTGTISFADENLITTGNVNATNIVATGTITPLVDPNIEFWLKPFGVTDTSIVDSSTNGFTPSAVDVDIYPGTCLYFGGGDEITYGDILFGSGDPMATGDFSITGWFRTGLDSNNYIFSKEVDNADEINLIVRTNLIQFWADTTAGGANVIRVKCETGVRTHRWTHLAITCDRDVGWKVYLDGVEQSLTDDIVSTNDISNNANFEVGIGRQSAGRYTGYLKDFRIYSRKLSEQEVWDLIQSANVLREVTQ